MKFIAAKVTFTAVESVMLNLLITS